MYNLDFDTVRQVMQVHQQTGRLYADVPSGIAHIRGPCRIEIKMKSGTIVACVISNIIGNQLTGKDAIYNLSRLGRLRWTLTPEPCAGKQPIATSIIVPQRAVGVEQLQMRSWSRLHKLVFGLADGATSTMKIAETLETSPNLVEQASRDLQKMGVITVKQLDGNNHP